jgi:hypothetical protein
MALPVIMLKAPFSGDDASMSARIFRYKAKITLPIGNSFRGSSVLNIV